MSDLDTKLERVSTHPGRASCFLHRHLSDRAGYVVLALDVRTRQPSLVATQSMDRLSVWEVFGPTTGDEEQRKAGPRCELAAEYRGTFDFDTKGWTDWRLLGEYPAESFEAPKPKAPPPSTAALSGRRRKATS